MTHGVDSDLRSFGDNQIAATADFITRSLLEAISSGNLSEVTEEMSNTMVHGLRNLAASINEDYDEEAFKALPRQLEFLRTFDRQVRLYRDGAAALARRSWRSKLLSWVFPTAPLAPA